MMERNLMLQNENFSARKTPRRLTNWRKKRRAEKKRTKRTRKGAERTRRKDGREHSLQSSGTWLEVA